MSVCDYLESNVLNILGQFVFLKRTVKFRRALHIDVSEQKPRLS